MEHVVDVQPQSLPVVDTILVKRKGGRPKGARNKPKDRETKLLEGIADGVPYSKAALAAGFSAEVATHPKRHLRKLLQTLEKKRELAAEKCGVTFEKQFGALVEIRDRAMPRLVKMAGVGGKDYEHLQEAASDGDRVKAMHEINLMMPGFLAPTKNQVEVRGVFVELAGMSNSDLAEMASLLEEANDAEFEDVTDKQ